MRRSRPRNSVVPSYRPHHRGDVTEVRPLSPGSGEGPRRTGTRGRRGEVRVGVPSMLGLPDLRFLIARGACAHGSTQSLANSVLRRLELDVWLTHPHLATPRGTCPSKTPCLARACNRRRARSCARESTGPCLCRASSRVAPRASFRPPCAGGRAPRPRSRPTSDARCPILAPLVPSFFPADSLRHLISLAYEANSCTRLKRAMSWIS